MLAVVTLEVRALQAMLDYHTSVGPCDLYKACSWLAVTVLQARLMGSIRRRLLTVQR